MSQTLSAIDGPTPGAPPFNLRLALQCDHGDHGLLTGATFTIDGEWYIDMRNIARDTGWRKTVKGWLGPCCSRVKAVAAPDD